MARVLVIFEHLSLNGGERSFLVLVETLRLSEFEFFAVAPPDGPLSDALSCANVDVLPLAFSNPQGTKRSRQELQTDIAGIIRRVRPDLLHANSLSTARITGPLAAASGVPSLGHLRDILKLSQAAVDDLNRHTRLLAVSEATREHHVAQGIDPAKVQVVYNGVDMDRFRPRSPTDWLQEELQLATTTRLVGGVGQIILRKGWDVWMAAAARVINQEADVHFVLIGQRHSTKDETLRLEQSIRDATQQAPWSGRVHLLGTRENMERLLPEFAVYAHAARQEPLGRVLLEAAACSVPVVATDVGGTREIFGDAGAILTPPDDAEQLAGGILNVLRRPTAAADRAQRTHEVTSILFDKIRAAESLAEHYHEVMSRCDQAMRR